jgi:hypothetical protein
VPMLYTHGSDEVRESSRAPARSRIRRESSSSGVIAKPMNARAAEIATFGCWHVIRRIASETADALESIASARKGSIR